MMRELDACEIGAKITIDYIKCWIMHLNKYNIICILLLWYVRQIYCEFYVCVRCTYVIHTRVIKWKVVRLSLFPLSLYPSKLIALIPHWYSIYSTTWKRETTKFTLKKSKKQQNLNQNANKLWTLFIYYFFFYHFEI